MYQIYNAEDEIDTDILRVIYNPTEENLRLLIGEREETEFICLGNEDSENLPPDEEFFTSSVETSQKDAKQNGYHKIPIKGAYNNWIFYSFMPILPKDMISLEAIHNDFKEKFPDFYEHVKKSKFPKKPPKNFKGDIKKKYPEYAFYKEKFPKQSDSENPNNYKSGDYDASLFNRSSLMLYSGLIKPANVASSKMIFMRNDFSFCYDDWYYFCREFVHFFRHRRWKLEQYALLLTGDAELKMNTNWHNYLNLKNNDLRQNIITVNLPHHGSKNNMNHETFESFNNIQNFLTFSGDQTKHGHPNAQAIKDAITAQPKANMIHVNQFQGLFEIVSVLDQ